MSKTLSLPFDDRPRPEPQRIAGCLMFWCPVCEDWGLPSMYSDSCTDCANRVEAHLLWDSPAIVLGRLRRLHEELKATE